MVVPVSRNYQAVAVSTVDSILHMFHPKTDSYSLETHYLLNIPKNMMKNLRNYGNLVLSHVKSSSFSPLPLIRVFESLRKTIRYEI
jgi:hypothetical protein